MTEPKEVILTEVSVHRNVIYLTYLCDICFENPRLKRKYKSHYHGGGDIEMTSFKEIDWNKRFSFGTRVPHCSNANIEYKRDCAVSPMTELITNLPEVRLMYDPSSTKLCPYLTYQKIVQQQQNEKNSGLSNIKDGSN